MATESELLLLLLVCAEEGKKIQREDSMCVHNYDCPFTAFYCRILCESRCCYVVFFVHAQSARTDRNRMRRRKNEVRALASAWARTCNVTVVRCAREADVILPPSI